MRHNAVALGVHELIDRKIQDPYPYGKAPVANMPLYYLKRMPQPPRNYTLSTDPYGELCFEVRAGESATILAASYLPRFDWMGLLKKK